MNFRLLTLALLLVITMISCTGATENQPTTVEDQVAALVSEKKFEDAIRLLKSADTNEPSIQSLLAKTHLDYGIYIEYDDNSLEMRDKMTSALRQYIEVLKIEPENEKARAEIDQIVAIYLTMPGRTLPVDILTELRERGLDGGLQADGEVPTEGN